MGPDQPNPPTETPKPTSVSSPPTPPGGSSASPSTESSTPAQPPAAVDPQSISIQPSHQPSTSKRPNLAAIVGGIVVLLIIGFLALLMTT